MRALVIAALVAIVPAKALACSCAPPPPPKKALEQADAVFTGEVTSVVRVHDDGTKKPFDPAIDLKAVEAEMKAGKPFPRGQVEVTFSVDRAWKGVEKSTVVIQTGVPVCCICIPAFRTGEKWILYAGGKTGSLSTSQCSRSTRLEHAAADVKALGKPARTFAAKPVATPAPGTVGKDGIADRETKTLALLPKEARAALGAATKGRAVDACAGRFTQNDVDEWAVTVLAPLGSGALAPDVPRIERWILRAGGAPVALDWTRGENFSVSANAEANADRLFYGELRCVKPAERPAFLKNFLAGFERSEATSVDLKSRDSACFSFDSIYDNWQCFGWSEEKQAFVRWGYQAVAD